MQLTNFISEPSSWALLAASLLFLLGLGGSFLPILPGTIIAWAGVILHKLWMGEASVSWTFAGIATVLMLLSVIADFLATAWGAQRFGATWRGAGGAIFGGILALFIPPQIVTIIVFPFAGAILAEILGGSQARPALRAGTGTLVGALVAFVLKLIFTLAIIMGFFISLP